MLRTVPIERLDMDYVDAFNKGVLTLITNHLKECSSLGPLRDLCVTQDLQTSLAWIINKNQRDTIIRQEISRTDVLLLPPIICECRLFGYLESSGIPLVRPDAVRTANQYFRYLPCKSCHVRQ